MAEREALSRLRLGVLAALVERLHDQPAEALPYAHALTLADPLSETGHAAVVRLLTRAGRNREAHSHYQRARRIFETELGDPPSEELEQARLALKSVPETSSTPSLTPVEAPLSAPTASSSHDAHLIGRKSEQAMIAGIIAATVQRQSSNFLLVIGEAGIGKSCILDCIARQVASAGGSVYPGRCFEAEATRPYGIWFDILRTVTHGRTPDEVPSSLGILLPQFGVAADATDRGQLFEAVVQLLRQVSMEKPLAILVDDIHWIDEASSSLLHYIARHLDTTSGLLIVCAAREGEIQDNAGASSVLRSLAREGRSQKIALGPLSSDETRELVRFVDPSLDGDAIFTQSDGNPLFAVGLAQARRRGKTDPGSTVEALIEGQLASLTEQAREVLLWAAAYGGALTPHDLARAARLESVELLTTLGELERHGFIRPISDDAYDFTHDLVRQTAYRTVSQPRRKLLHRQIAKILEEVSSRDNTFAADLA